MNLARVENWLQQHTGLDASTLGAGVVARAARERIDGLSCKSIDDYLAILAASAAERQALIERVVVPETWFFRDRAALDALARHVVETWGPTRPGATFRVLSVPCSTGEEPYSIAMALARAGWPLTHLRVEAIDISRANLARAAEGVYRRNSFRGDDQAFRDIYFTPAGSEAWRVNDTVCAPVHFEHGNLLADDFAIGRLPYDAIFCRNLLIYFDRPTQARAIRTLERLLAPGAWIAVGPAEPVLFFEHSFSALRIPSAFLLHKPPAAAIPPPKVERRAAPSAPLAWERGPSGYLNASAGRTLRASKPSPPAKPLESDSLSSVRALADAGRLREAAERGAALLARSEPSVDLLYTLAVVADAAGDAERAEALYRKTLYLDPQHTEALSHLALLAEKRGDLRGARQFRERARRLMPRKEAV
jgi:chemotaxis protein methyltransferase WspC